MAKVVGILNITPDSYYDGGRYTNLECAQRQVHNMLEAGVDVIDIGCESTRPNSNPITVEEELARLKPILPTIRNMTDIPLAVDTYKTEVMAYALDSGVNMINDIFALRSPGALDLVARYPVQVCLMHLHESVSKMHEKPMYEDVAQTIIDFFMERIEACYNAGIEKERLILDPGFGFSKQPVENFQLLRDLSKFKQLKLPLYIGISRKRFIGQLLKDNTPDDRLIGSLVASVWAWQQGVDYIRTHDVAETKEALAMIETLDIR